MGEKVFLVCSGAYSDYGVRAVYSEDQRALAEEYTKLIGGEVEEYPLNEPAPEDPGLEWFAVYVEKSAKTQVQTRSRLDRDGNRREEKVMFRTYEDCPEYSRWSHWRLSWYGYAKSQEHAVCQANELRCQILAGQRPPGVDMGKN